MTEFLLYRLTCIIEGVFLVAGLWIVQIGFVEAIFLSQQLLDRVAVFVKLILVLSARGF